MCGIVGRITRRDNKVSLSSEKKSLVVNSIRHRGPDMQGQYEEENVWVGRCENITAHGKQYCREIDQLLSSYPEVEKAWHWLGERNDIPALLAAHHALILGSYHEGLPNVVCEALATGRPVLASNVCDNPFLVESSVRGFLFDPSSPELLANAIEQLVLQGFDNWTQMSHQAREYTQTHLSF